LTTYQQHLQYWSEKKIFVHPRKKFLQDLSQEIQQWQEAGEKILVFTDMNEDVLSTGHQAIL